MKVCVMVTIFAMMLSAPLKAETAAVGAKDTGGAFLIQAPARLHPKYPTRYEFISDSDADGLLVLQLSFVIEEKVTLEGGGHKKSLYGKTLTLIFPEPVDASSLTRRIKDGQLFITVNKAPLDPKLLPEYQKTVLRGVEKLKKTYGQEVFDREYMVIKTS